MAQKGNQKIWLFLVIWLVLFLVVKSIEKILLITIVGAAIYWISKGINSAKRRRLEERENGKNKKN